MVPIFSATPSELGESSALAELQLLPDQELMSLWEQTQFVVAALEGAGGSAKTALPAPAPQTSPQLMVVNA